RIVMHIALRDSEIRYRRLFETTPHGIMILDGETGIVVDANPCLCTLLEYPWDTIIGNTLWELTPFRDASAIKTKFRELRHTDHVRYDDLPLETKTHGVKHVEIVGSKYVAAGKDVVQFNFREITDRVMAEHDARKEQESMAALLVVLKRRDEQMRVINRLNELLQSCTSAEEAYKVIALLAGELFELRPGACAIVQSPDGRLETVARWGGETRMQTLFGMEDCWAIRRGQPHEASESEGRLWCAHFTSQPEGGTYCVPLTVQGETLGLLTIIGGGGTDRESLESDHQLAQSMGEAIKLSLSNLRLRAKLKEQATHDALTGLYNIRYLEEYLPRELHRSARAGSPLCIAMLDLDQFKRLNDTLGHHAGDVVLREVGSLLTESLRKSDMAIRYGGEEFLLVLPDSSVDDAKRCVDQIRDSVRKIPFPDVAGSLPPMTLSVGIAIAGEHGTTASALIRAADMALYAAKRAGRDRVIVYEG
ncbi:MAG TPA: sensor domain-containing diguanylate cyclase, partial [Gemmatimonadaceae bacterium]|nr:sensor domain-containing diguanylate cyclase [Gemmatimonadaceae bacterium]